MVKVGDLVRIKKSAVESGHMRWVKAAAWAGTPMLVTNTETPREHAAVFYEGRIRYLTESMLTKRMLPKHLRYEIITKST